MSPEPTTTHTMAVDEFGREIPSYGAATARPSSPPDYKDRRYRDEERVVENNRYERRSRRTPSPSPRRHGRPPAIERYVQDPMLCEFVWKAQAQQSAIEKVKEEADERPLAGEDTNDSADQQEGSKQTYEEYRHQYCLNYVRAFFNEHMDDSWFRNRYSPLCRKRLQADEFGRSAAEAKALIAEVEDSVQKFVQNARLGAGIKREARKRKHGDSDAASDNTTPSSHMLSPVTSKSIVRLMDVPPHVTEEQITNALLDHASKPGQAISVHSASVAAQDSQNPLNREAFVVFADEQTKKDILGNLLKASHEASGHIPRKDDRKVLELEVECSDPYGRAEAEDDEAGGTIPQRKATIYLSTDDMQQKVVVLSAAVSSKQRIPKDKDAALLIARALDVRRKIPRESRLDDVLDKLPPDMTDEDMLDVCIAYLRRIHLFSFYNGCVFSESVADVMRGYHPTSTIHLRLKNADDLLQKTREENDDMYGDLQENDEGKTTDLLVMRLDESIRKALEETSEWASSDFIVSPQVDALAAEIEGLEIKTQQDWIDQHAIVDDDGRARCSFHFCRKLFKDGLFLRKHLLKKHSQYLKAEVAKCHDSYMMQSWDAEDQRPVPPIFVDCGTNFGLVPSYVTGGEHPSAPDPEPDLWKKEEDRRKRLAQQEAHRQQQHRHHDDEAGGDGASAPPRRSNNFVDVDDMKEEKVELSFENVTVPVQPPKKKKKKKKKLL